MSVKPPGKETGAIAIIGMSGRFPGAPDVESLWRNLVAGVDSISRFSEPELEFSHPREPGSHGDHSKVIRARGVLDGVDLFDAEFFGIYPKEAELMDPQHRLFLEVAWEAIESAGYDPLGTRCPVGVYAGLSFNTYLVYNLCRDRVFAEAFAGGYQVDSYPTLLGNDKDFLATRVSYRLNLRGPSMAVQTACSTSLVAISEACTALCTHQCDMALAGGVSITFPQKRDYLYQEEGMVSGDGTCRTFDAAACGTVFGHGVGVVFLKRLEDAIEAGDPILAVIRGWAVNNDGSAKAGYAAPSVRGQADVISAAQAAAGISPEAISYVEAHGTGTPLGDPIEVAALTEAFRGGGATGTGFCALGSAKSNIGHLDAAAGATGLIKVVLQLQHETIPGLAHFKSPNPRIDFASSPFYPAAQALPWKRGPEPRRAGVSAFGVGGTNAHLVVEEAPTAASGSTRRTRQLLVLSARTAPALDRMRTRLADHLERNPHLPLADAAWTLQSGRRPFKHRLAVVAGDAAEAAARLRAPDPKSGSQGTVEGVAPGVVFLFPGQGAQYCGMGRELYDSEPAFREEVDRCAAILREPLGLDIREVLYPEDAGREAAGRRINETAVTQPCIFVVEYALARLWMSWGVKPAALLGHSIGEYVAAVIAGVFTLENALRLLAARARLMQALPPGSMLAVRCGAAQLEPLLPKEVSLAAVNSPKLCTVSGPTPVLELFAAELERRKIAARFLPTSHAFHSAMMDPMLPEFTRIAGQVPCAAPAIPWISTLTGRWITPQDLASGDYWTRQLRHTVLFATALADVGLKPDSALLEVGPGQSLCQLARQLPGRPAATPVVASLGPTDDTGHDRATMLSSLGKLWTAGLAPDWEGLHAGERRLRVSLPTYAFERQRYWVAPPAQGADVPASPNATATATATTHPIPSPKPVTPEPVSAPVSERRPRLVQEVRELLRELSGVDIGTESATFVECGFDSLFLTQASQALQGRFGLKITFRQLLGELGSLGAVADHLDATLPPDPPAMAVAAPASAASTVPAATAGLPPLSEGLAGLNPSTLELLLTQQLQLIQCVLAERAALAQAPPTPAPVASPAGPAAILWPGPGPVPDSRDPAAEHAPLSASQQRALGELATRLARKSAGSLQAATRPRPPSSIPEPRDLLALPLVCERAVGARLWDVDGNDYVDVSAAQGGCFFGHAPAWLSPVLRRPAGTGAESGLQPAAMSRVATLLRRFTGLDGVRFCANGTEALRTALRAARAATGRRRVVCLVADAASGSEELQLRAAWNGGQYASVPSPAGASVENPGEIILLDHGTPESLDIIRRHAGDIAAVVLEPVPCDAPELFSAEYLRELRVITAGAGTLLVMDERVTGFQCHPGGALGLLGGDPDLVIYGEALAAGLPMGVLAGRACFVAAADGTAAPFSNPAAGLAHPMSVAAADGFLTQLKQEGPRLQAELSARVDAFCRRVNEELAALGAPLGCRHFGSFATLRPPTDLEHLGLLWPFLRDKGVHATLRRPFFFTRAHEPADFERVAKGVRDAVREMQGAGFLPREGTRLKPLPAQGGPASRNGSTPAREDLRNGSAHSRPHAAAVRTHPLTDGQKEMWISAQIQPEAVGTFNGCNVVELAGPLQVDSLKEAIRKVVARHEALRATCDVDGVAIRVSEDVEAVVLFHDLAVLPADERPEAIQRILDEDGRRLFDIEHGPVAVFQILRRAPEEHLLVFNVNMLFCDGWGYAVILEEIAAIYSSIVAREEARLGPIVPMRQYHAWQQLPEQRAAAKRAEDFWVDRFQTVPPPLDLPTPHARPAVRTCGGARHSLHLPEDLCNEIRQAARRLGATPFALYFAAYQVWLHRLTEATDLVIGVPFAGQAGMGGENVVGQCVHTLPLRGAIDPAAPFAGLLQRARDLILDAQENWNTTFGAVAQRLELPRDASRIPLVSVIFNLDPPLSRVQFKGLRRQVNAGPRHYFQYDLGFNLVDEGTTLTVECDYSTAVLDGEWVRIWLGHFQTLLRGIVANPQAAVSELPMLSLEESQRMLTAWNDTRRPTVFPTEGGVHGLVGAQAARTPDAVAVEFNGVATSYRELESRASQLAAHLAAAGVGPGSVVALCVGRCTELVVALLAVLKAGGAYVPVDPDLPAARIQLMLQDAAPVLVLTQQSLEDRFEGSPVRRLCLDALPAGAPPAAGMGTPANGAPVADSLAYIIYTSGSTGVPKGVEVAHRSVVNFLGSMQQEPGLAASDTMLALTRLSFDIAGLELLLPLVVGARVVIAPREATVDPGLLAALIAQSGITVMQATPATYRMLLASGWSGGARLRLLCGGEAMAADLARDLAGRCRELWNLYGPAETTIWSTATRVQPGDPVSIGRPIANTSVYVVDPRMRPVPVGVAGELLIGGAGLARGYRNQPRLTAERFVSSPFSATPGERVYRTGDVARFRPDGRLEFLGRRDQQVKIRGYRVELGEIEAVLLAQPRVQEVVVTSREDGPEVRILVAYVVPDDPRSLEGADRAALIGGLRTALRAVLPEYMVPSAFVVLPALPHSANGKIDRRALPAPEGERLEVQDGYVAPSTPTQEKLARMWMEILKIDRVGIRDNFFDLGGQSLRAVALFGRIERDFGRKLPLATLFSCPTIELLARRLDDSEARPELERWASLVPIQTQGRSKPLFLVHGAGGNVLLYQALAAHMAPDHPLYGLQSQGLDGKTAPLRTVEEMAVHYLEEVRRVQPKGPYYLGGYCMGGTIAYEMAQRLLEEGETVALVAMLDTYNFALMLKGRSAVFLVEKLRFHLGNFVRLRPSQMWEYFKEKMRVAMDGEWINLLGYKGTVESDTQSSAQASVQAINDRAGEIYAPRSFPGTLTLFKPRVNYSCYPDPNMGWKDLVQGKLEIVELPVNPHAMLVEPFVKQLAATLRSHLDPGFGASASENPGRPESSPRRAPGAATARAQAGGPQATDLGK